MKKVEETTRTKRSGRAALFLIAVTIAAVVAGILLAGCSDGEKEESKDIPEPEKQRITDVMLLNEITEYDGQAHGVRIAGLKETDGIEYSRDGESWQSEVVTYTDAGKYTVYVRVEREGYEIYESSAEVKIDPKEITGVTAEDITVTEGEKIEPKISGTEETDEIRLSMELDKGIEHGTYTVEYEVMRKNHKTKTGQFILTVKEKEEIKVTVNGKEYGTEKKEKNEIEITAEGTTVRIKINNAIIAEIENCNYCEEISGVINTERDYKTNTLTAETEKNEIAIELSLRKEREETVIEERYMYDGQAHGIETENVLNGQKYTEVGEYETTAVVLKDGYLPKEMICIVKILPDMTGVYVRDNGVIEIDGTTAKINNKSAEYIPDVEKGTIGGKEVIYGQTEITIDGETYTLTTDKYIAIETDDEITVIRRNGGNYRIRIGETTTTLETDDGDIITELNICEVTGVYFNGDERVIEEEDGFLFASITEDEMYDFQIAWVAVG